MRPHLEPERTRRSKRQPLVVLWLVSRCLQFPQSAVQKQVHPAEPAPHPYDSMARSLSISGPARAYWTSHPSYSLLIVARWQIDLRHTHVPQSFSSADSFSCRPLPPSAPRIPTPKTSVFVAADVLVMSPRKLVLSYKMIFIGSQYPK